MSDDDPPAEGAAPSTPPTVPAGWTALDATAAAAFAKNVLLSASRTRPVVAVTTYAAGGEPTLDPADLARKIGGHADIVTLETGDPTCRRVRPLVLAVAALLLAAGAAACRGEPERPPSPYTHQATGMLFPAKVLDLDLGKVKQYADDGSDVSVHYDDPGPLSLFYATVYVYPVGDGATFESEFDRCAADVLKGHAGTKYEGVGPIDVVFGGQPVHGRKAKFSIPVSETLGLFNDSYLLLVRRGSWWLKIRTTYPHQHPPSIDDRVNALLTMVFEQLPQRAAMPPSPEPAAEAAK